MRKISFTRHVSLSLLCCVLLCCYFDAVVTARFLLSPLTDLHFLHSQQHHDYIEYHLNRAQGVRIVTVFCKFILFLCTVHCDERQVNLNCINAIVRHSVSQ